MANHITSRPATTISHSNGSAKPENPSELSCTGPSTSTPSPLLNNSKAPQPEMRDPAAPGVDSDYGLNTNTATQHLLKLKPMRVFSLDSLCPPVKKIQKMLLLSNI